MDKKQARAVFVGTNLVLGIAFVLFLRFSMRVYGIDPDENPGAAYPCRYLGANSLVFAAMLYNDATRAALIKTVPVLAAGDVGANVLALRTGEVPKRVALLGTVTSAANVVLVLLSRE